MPRFLYSPDCDDPESDYVGIVAIQYDGPDDEVGAHKHPSGHWSFVVAGTVEYTVGAKVTVATAPHQLWIPKGVLHSMRCLTPKATSICVMPKGQW